MREAVGGSILFYIILGFVGIFITFIGIIMNYAAAYRANNYAVTTIEQYEGNYAIGSSGSGTGTLAGDLKKRGYYNGASVSCTDVGGKGAVFKVVTHLSFRIPLLDVTIPLNITNETKTLYDVSCSGSSSVGDWNV